MIKFNENGDFEKSVLKNKDLQLCLNDLKKKNNGKLLQLLEKLGIDYCVLSMEDYKYFRVRVVLSSEEKNYAYTDIYFSNYENCYIAKDYLTW